MLGGGLRYGYGRDGRDGRRAEGGIFTYQVRVRDERDITGGTWDEAAGVLRRTAHRHR